MDKIEILHNFRKISRKIVTARELIDEVCIEFDLISSILSKEVTNECTNQDTDLDRS